MEQIYGPNMLFEDLTYAFSVYTLMTNVSKTSLSPISDLERIFAYNITTISSWQVTWKKEK